MEKKIKAAKTIAALLKLVPSEHKEAFGSLSLEDAKISLWEILSPDPIV